MLYEHFRKSGRRGAEDRGIDCLSEIFIMQGRIRLQGVYRHWHWDEGSDATDWMGKESKSAGWRRSKGRGLSINTGEQESYNRNLCIWVGPRECYCSGSGSVKPETCWVGI